MSSFSEERKQIRNQNMLRVMSLTDRRREVVRNMHRMSKAGLKELEEGDRFTINRFPLIR